MDTIQIFKKAAGLTWRYRLLWLFGFALALTVSNALYWLPFARDDQVVVENRIILSNTSTIYLPGEGVTIDFSSPGAPIIRIEGLEPGWYRDLSGEVRLSDLWALLISIGVVVLIGTFLPILLRYTSIAALIRMVDEHERSEKMVNIRGGLHLGWSRVAGKLFLIDLCLTLAAILVFSLLLALVMSPLLLLSQESVTDSVVSVIRISLFALVGLPLFVFLAFIVAVLLSIVRPVMYQACAVDGSGVGASIRQGFRLLKTRFVQVIMTWLVWLAVRLVWIFALIPVVILLFPVLLLSVMAGVVLGAVPALLAAGIASLYVSPLFAWLIGAIVGLPLFLGVTFAPITFLSGLVEVFKSSFWTLSYRDFRPLVRAVSQPAEGSTLPRLDTALAH